MRIFHSIDKARRLKDEYKSSLRDWVVPSIDRNKKFCFVKKDRTTFTAELTLVNCMHLDNEISNELRNFKDNFQKASEHSIKISELITFESRCCFIRGIPGAGKTSLCEFITLKFALLELYNEQFDFVFLVKCRELERLGSESIDDYFQRKFGILPNELRSFGDRVLIVLDGADEVACLQAKLSDVSWINTLLSTSSGFMPRHSTIITGRPHIEACLKRHQGDLTGLMRTVEIAGLAQPEIVAHIHEFANGNKDVEDRILNVMERSPSMLALASIPQYLNSFCCVLAMERGDIEIERMTTLYMWILVSLVRQHFEPFKALEPFEIFESAEFVKMIQVVSKISYELLLRNEIQFTSGEFLAFDEVLEDSKMTEIMRVFFVEVKNSFASWYQFQHLTLHEFFAAIHCYVAGINVRELLCREMFELVTFLCGFVSAEDPSNSSITHLFVNCLKPGKQIPKETTQHLSRKKKRLNLKFLFSCARSSARGEVEVFGEATNINLFNQVVGWFKEFKKQFEDTFPLRCCLKIAHEMLSKDFRSTEMLNSTAILHLYPHFDNTTLRFTSFLQSDCIMLVHFIHVLKTNGLARQLKDVELIIYQSSFLNKEEYREFMACLYLFKGVWFFSCDFEEGLFKYSRESIKQSNTPQLEHFQLIGCELCDKDKLHLANFVIFVDKVRLSSLKLSLEMFLTCLQSIKEAQEYGTCELKELRIWGCEMNDDLKQRFLKIENVNVDIKD